MKALYPTKAKASSILPGTPVATGKEAAKTTQDSDISTPEAIATQAVGLLKTLNDKGLLGLVVIDELHQ